MELGSALVALLEEQPRWRNEVFVLLVHLTTGTPSEAEANAIHCLWPVLEVLVGAVPPQTPRILDLVRARLERAVAAGESLPAQAAAHAAAALRRLAKNGGLDTALTAADYRAIFRPTRRLSAWSTENGGDEEA
jgi:hypothetical protein